jgi:putative endonuclease
MSRAAAEQRGRRAEAIAAIYLQLKGWRIIARRRRMPMIELDLVARRGQVLAVVEVKHRPTLDAALTALRPEAAARLQRAAAQLAAEAAHKGRAAPVARVDLIALAPGRWPRHIAGVQ